VWKNKINTNAVKMKKPKVTMETKNLNIV